MDQVFDFLNRESRQMLMQAERLQRALTHFRYESRILRDKNLKAARQAIAALDGFMKRHRRLQEKIVFPFLMKHVPRHEAAIHFLETEHADLRRSEELLRRSIGKMVKEGGALHGGEIYEHGVYLVALLRHHLGFEARSVEATLRTELRKDEKAFITSRILTMLKKNKQCLPSSFVV